MGILSSIEANYPYGVFGLVTDICITGAIILALARWLSPKEKKDK